MKRVEAPTLEEAYQQASQLLQCSIAQLQCEVVQHPSKGFLGLFKKTAIIVAIRKREEEYDLPSAKEEHLFSPEESVASEIMATLQEAEQKERKDRYETPRIIEESVVEQFFEYDSDASEEEESQESLGLQKDGTVVYDELARLIESQLEALLACSCFEIDVVEVDVRDNVALIFIDGEDAALLIGKEGYRYNALSYMLFNWLYSKYELFIKLEIAEFLTTQQEMIRVSLQPLIETIEQTGRGKTRFLDGILVQIALEQLRTRFPNRYVAVKSTKDGKKFVVVNEFKSNVS